MTGAFVVAPEHIDILLKAGLTGLDDTLFWFSPILGRHRNLRADNRDEVGVMLRQQNVRSVVRCLRLDDRLALWDAVRYAYRDPIYQPTPVEALSAINCYQYQSSEHPGWERSEAREFTQALKEALILRLPGYDVAPWEWNSVDVLRKRVEAWRDAQRS